MHRSHRWMVLQKWKSRVHFQVKKIIKLYVCVLLSHICFCLFFMFMYPSVELLCVHACLCAFSHVWLGTCMTQNVRIMALLGRLDNSLGYQQPWVSVLACSILWDRLFVVCFRAGQTIRPTGFWGFSYFSLPSCFRRTGISDTCCCTELYMSSGESNTGPHAYLSSDLPTEPSP